MPRILGPYGGPVDLKPGQSVPIFLDLTMPGGLDRCAWVATAIPNGPDPDSSATLNEQRLEVTQVSMLMKGKGATAPGQLQLNYTVRNIGSHQAKGNVVVYGILPE